MNKELERMIDDLKQVIQELKPELLTFLSAMVMGTLQLVAEPEGNRSFMGSAAEVISISIMAVAVAGIARLFGFDDPNISTFIGCAMGIMGYKTTRKIIIFFFRGQLK